MPVAVEQMPSWVAEEYEALAALPEVLPEVPDWLLDAPASEKEPRCACGCATLSELAAQADTDPAGEPAAEPVRWAVPGVWGEQPAPVTPSVGALVGRLQDLAAQVTAVEAALLPPGQALGEAAALERVLHQLRLSRLARTSDVRDRALHEHLGYRSLAAWQRSVAPDVPAGDRTLSRRLGQAPHLAAALDAAAVSFTAAGKVAGALVKVRGQLDRPDGLIDGQPAEPVVQAVVWNVVDLIGKDRFGLVHDPAVDPAQAALLTTLEAAAQRILAAGGSQHDRVEQAMVLLAGHVRPETLSAALDELVDQLLPSVLEEQDQAAQDKRALSLTPRPDGTWELSATLTPECGEQLHAALAAEARRDPANPLDTHAREQARAAAAQAAGTDPVQAVLDRPAWETRALRDTGDSWLPDGDQLVPRSRSKRLHDAFQRLLTRYLGQGLGGVNGKVPVQASVTISARTIEGTPGAPPGKGGSGRPLARSLIRRWWCNAHITTVLMSHGWQPLGIVHTARTITGTELKAARIQFDQRCPGLDCCPGTPDPLTPLVPHHVTMHATHGTTSLGETLLVCERLHQDIHLGTKPIRLRDGRLITQDGYLDPDT